MSEIKDLLELLTKLPGKRALIVDDAYDTSPDADALRGVQDDVKKKVGQRLRQVSVKVRQALGARLVAAGFEEDDFESGMEDDDFVALVWNYKEKGKLRGKEYDDLFSPFLKEQENKRADLEPVEALLRDTLGFTVETQGKKQSAPKAEPTLILLDLFLSFVDEKDAIDTSVARIQKLMEEKPETGRPLIVLMSTRAEKLGNVGLELKQRAGLMGSKFRTAHKEELNPALLTHLEDMLRGFEDAERYAEWIEAWKGGLDRAKDELVKRLRLLDLSDLAYLTRYRLQVEGMPLGTYLRKLAEDQIISNLEDSSSLETRTLELNSLQFPKMPSAHFLPSEALPKLKHCSSFVSDRILQTDGYQFEDAKGKLVLGDILVAKPRGWKPNMPVPLLEGTETLVVLSQSCDILQCKADSVLFLRGRLTRRTWIDDVNDPQSHTDVFIFNGEQFQIDWQKAKMTAWEVRMVNNRLAPRSGSFLRIARYRELEALRLQNLFASNLTRVGLFTDPHQHWNVGVRIKVPCVQGEPTVLIETPASESPAAVIKARYFDDRNRPQKGNILIFDPKYKEKFVEACGAFDWQLVRPQMAEQFKQAAASQEALNAFANSHTKTIALGSLTIQILPADGIAPKDKPSLQVLGPAQAVAKAARE